MFGIRATWWIRSGDGKYLRSMCTNAVERGQYTQLVSEVRTLFGSKASRKLRLENKVPGVLYGVDDDNNVVKVAITLNKKDLNREIRVHGLSFENTIYELVIDGQKHIVSPRQLQIHPLTDDPLNINFLIYRNSNRFRIPIQYINEDLCTDIKRGNFIIPVNKFVECVCDGNVPSVLIVDLADVKLGDVLRTSAVQFPAGVRLSVNVPPDYVIGVLSSE